MEQIGRRQETLCKDDGRPLFALKWKGSLLVVGVTVVSNRLIVGANPFQKPGLDLKTRRQVVHQINPMARRHHQASDQASASLAIQEISITQRKRVDFVAGLTPKSIDKKKSLCLHLRRYSPDLQLSCRREFSGRLRPEAQRTRCLL